MLERMIQHITQHEGVWITHMSEIADEFRSRTGQESRDE
jgi:hypothetical protein